jgi:A/G-specific adenine glycosylase
MLDKNTAADFNKELQQWFRAHGRILPWRKNPSPYAVLVSEFMLQQTTVAAVQPYFQRWMKSFPDVRTLAAATEEEVLKHWQGLGYYSRARNLHRAAQAIVATTGGKIPGDLTLLRKLPGVGPYTASAIVAFAFDTPVPVLDANIQRVITRLFDFKENIVTAAGRSFLDQAAASLLPESGGRDHASALMDLGATICRAGQPDCASCPVARFCKATEPALLPLKPEKKAVTQLVDWRAFCIRRGKIFLIQSPGPVWKGLWTLPPAPASDQHLCSIRYAITRYRVDLHVVSAEPQPEWQSFPLADLPPMPSPHRRALAALLLQKTNCHKHELVTLLAPHEKNPPPLACPCGFKSIAHCSGCRRHSRHSDRI